MGSVFSFSFAEKEPIPIGTVLLHAGLPRGPRTPTLSPFVMKLETYLRIADIPYKFTDRGGYSVKGKVPWIEYNGESVCDSHFIIKYLDKKFSVGLDKNLTPQEKAKSTAFRIMAEEFFLYAFELEIILWNDADGIRSFLGGVNALPLPLPLIWLYKSQIKSRAKSQGVGAHSQDQVRRLAEEQLRAMSTALGENKFFMGEEPTEIDCTMMGILGLVRWHMKGMYLHNLINKKFQNINKYLDTMKKTFYPDWDQLVASGNRSRSPFGPNGTNETKT